MCNSSGPSGMMDTSLASKQFNSTNVKWNDHCQYEILLNSNWWAPSTIEIILCQEHCVFSDLWDLYYLFCDCFINVKLNLNNMLIYSIIQNNKLYVNFIIITYRLSFISLKTALVTNEEKNKIIKICVICVLLSM